MSAVLAESQTEAKKSQRMHNKQPLIEAKNVSFHAGGRQILDHISLTVSAGETVTLIGPNGAGKTTLLRVLLGLIPATSGSITKKPGLRIGYLPQKTTIDPVLPLSVSRLMTLTGSYSSSQVRASLKETGVDHLNGESVFNLSGGEFQRVMLARALLRNPELLVLDEPVQGVDYLGEADLYRLIANIRKQYHCSVLMISHDLHVVMASTDRVICIDQHVCCQGKPQYVTNHPEYQRLFGVEAAESLAIYDHHHDHKHDITGKIQVTKP